MTFSLINGAKLRKVIMLNVTLANQKTELPVHRSLGALLMLTKCAFLVGAPSEISSVLC